MAIAPGVRWLRMPLPFALDHINLWLLEDGEDVTLVDTGYANAATRELWERHFADTLGGKAVDAHRRHALPSRSPRQRGLDRATAFGCRVTMTHGEFMSAHAIIDERAAHAPADTCELFRLHGMSADDVRAQAARGNQYQRGVPVAPPSFDRIKDGDAIRAAGTMARDRGFGHSSEHASLFAARSASSSRATCCCQDQHERLRVAVRPRTGDPLGRFLDSLSSFESLPPHSLVLPSHGSAVPRHSHARRTASLTPRCPTGRASRGDGSAGGGPAPGWSAADMLHRAVPARARLAATLFRDGGKPSRTSIICGTAAASRDCATRTAATGSPFIRSPEGSIDVDTRHRKSQGLARPGRAR
jgi:glyoxylase-like metal-dependent hydrolase (beta-lactamase superfamily II)